MQKVVKGSNGSKKLAKSEKVKVC